MVNLSLNALFTNGVVERGYSKKHYRDEAGLAYIQIEVVDK